METNNPYHVNIYYSEEEVHDAFNNYYNDVKQASKVHIFTNNSTPLSIYGEKHNVDLYSSRGLWEKLKARMTGESQFNQHFSKLNISKENQERYLSIIKNGGTIIVSTQDESINLPIKVENEINVESAVPPLPSTIPNDVNLLQTNSNDLRIDSQTNGKEISTVNVNDINQEVANTPFDTQSDEKAPSDTEDQSFTKVAEEPNAFELNDTSEMDAQQDKGTNTDLALQNTFNEKEETNTLDNADDQKINEELIVKNELSFNTMIQPTVDEQNLYVADVSTSDQVPFANQQKYEYYEDGPRKHNLYSENLKKLSNEQKKQTTSDNNEEPFVVPTNHDTVSRNPDETSNHTVDIMDILNNYDTNQEDLVNSVQQLQDLAQQAQQFYGFDNKQSQINELLELVLQLPDEVLDIFNKISNSNITTDSTESVLNFDLLAKLGGYETDEVKNLFVAGQESEKETIITSTEQNDLSYTAEIEQLLDKTSPETTSEHNRNDSP